VELERIFRLQVGKRPKIVIKRPYLDVLSELGGDIHPSPLQRAHVPLQVCGGFSNKVDGVIDLVEVVVGAQLIQHGRALFFAAERSGDPLIYVGLEEIALERALDLKRPLILLGESGEEVRDKSLKC
jgi:hypothetical protein